LIKYFLNNKVDILAFFVCPLKQDRDILGVLFLIKFEKSYESQLVVYELEVTTVGAVGVETVGDNGFGVIT
jgi:hypothetical protein